MSKDNQLSRALAVGRALRRVSRTKAPMRVEARYYPRHGCTVWNVIGHYGQVILGYKTPRRAKQALRECLYLQRCADGRARAELSRNFDDINTSPIHVEVCFIDTEQEQSFAEVGKISAEYMALKLARYAEAYGASPSTLLKVLNV